MQIREQDINTIYNKGVKYYQNQLNKIYFLENTKIREYFEKDEIKEFLSNEDIIEKIFLSIDNMNLNERTMECFYEDENDLATEYEFDMFNGSVEYLEKLCKEVKLVDKNQKIIINLTKTFSKKEKLYFTLLKCETNVYSKDNLYTENLSKQLYNYIINNKKSIFKKITDEYIELDFPFDTYLSFINNKYKYIDRKILFVFELMKLNKKFLRVLKYNLNESFYYLKKSLFKDLKEEIIGIENLTSKFSEQLKECIVKTLKDLNYFGYSDLEWSFDSKNSFDSILFGTEIEHKSQIRIIGRSSEKSSGFTGADHSKKVPKHILIKLDITKEGNIEKIFLAYCDLNVNKSRYIYNGKSNNSYTQLKFKNENLNDIYVLFGNLKPRKTFIFEEGMDITKIKFERKHTNIELIEDILKEEYRNNNNEEYVFDYKLITKKMLDKHPIIFWDSKTPNLTFHRELSKHSITKNSNFKIIGNGLFSYKQQSNYNIQEVI